MDGMELNGPDLDQVREHASGELGDFSGPMGIARPAVDFDGADDTARAAELDESSIDSAPEPSFDSDPTESEEAVDAKVEPREPRVVQPAELWLDTRDFGAIVLRIEALSVVGATVAIEAADEEDGATWTGIGEDAGAKDALPVDPMDEEA